MTTTLELPIGHGDIAAALPPLAAIGLRDLQAALKAITPALNRRVPLERQMRVEVRDDSTVRLQAVGPALSVQLDLPATACSPGVMLLPALDLASALVALTKGHRKRDLDKATVTLFEDDGTAHVTALGRNLPLPTDCAVQNYPAMPSGAPGAYRVDRDSLVTAGLQTTFAADGSGIVPILTGVEMVAGAGGLQLTATDRYRLVRTMTPGGGDEHFVTVAPAALLGKILPTLRGHSVQLGLDGGHLTVRAEHSLHVITTLPGEYPGVASILGQAWEFHIELDRAAFLGTTEAVIKTHKAVGPRYRDEPIVLDVTGTEATVSQWLDEAEDVHTVLPALDPGQPWPLGDRGAMRILANPLYLLEALRSLTSSTVRLTFTGLPWEPFALTEGGVVADGSAAHRYLQMTVRFGS